jgi:hypothetical protein
MPPAPMPTCRCCDNPASPVGVHAGSILTLCVPCTKLMIRAALQSLRRPGPKPKRSLTELPLS